MDKKQETQRLADEAKAKLIDPNETAISPGTTVRADMIPVDQSDAQDIVDRQIKVQEEAEEQERSAVAAANYNATQQVDPLPAAEADKPKARAKKESLVEVQVKSKYTPHYIEDEDGNLVKNSGVMQTVPAGTTIKLPAAEAERALMLGIANVTGNTFKR